MNVSKNILACFSPWRLTYKFTTEFAVRKVSKLGVWTAQGRDSCREFVNYFSVMGVWPYSYQRARSIRGFWDSYGWNRKIFIFIFVSLQKLFPNKDANLSGLIFGSFLLRSCILCIVHVYKAVNFQVNRCRCGSAQTVLRFSEADICLLSTHLFQFSFQVTSDYF